MDKLSDSTVVGQLALELGIDTDSLRRQLTQATDNADKQLTSGFSKIGKKIGGILGGLAAGAFIKDCLDLGSDLAEVQNVVDTSFKSMSSYVDNFAKDAMENFGLSETVAKQYMGTLGAMNNAFGFTEQASYDMAKAVTGLTGDVASFYNLESDEAFTKLKSIWTGETETLKDLGVVMTQTALDQYALNNGFGKTTAKMTEQEKVLLRYQYVTSALSDATGDFVKTQDSWANQTRVLSLRFDSLKASLGQGFINLFTPIIKGLNVLLTKLSAAAEGFKNFTAFITGNTNTTEGLGNIASTASDAAGEVDNITSSAKEAQKQLMGFDKITKLSDKSDSGGDSKETSTASTTISPIIGSEQTAGEMGIFAQSILKAIEPLKNISFDSLRNSLNRLKEALEPLTNKLFDGLRWGYENVFVPLAGWTIEDLAPAFIDVLSGAFQVLNSVLDVLKPLWMWAWKKFFLPVAKWTGGKIVDILKGLASGLEKISDWISSNQSIVQGMAITVGIFAAAWKSVSLAEFLINAGGVTGMLTRMTTALKACTIAKIADKIETVKIVALYAKDFVIGIAKGTAELVKNTAQWIANKATLLAGTAATIASTVATNAATAATWLFNTALAVLTSPITLVIAAIAALVSGIYLLIKNWDTVKDVAGNIWNHIVQIWKNVADWFKQNVIIPLKQFFIGLWDGIKAVWNGTVGFFTSIFQMAWNGIKSAWSGVTSFFSNIWEGIKNAFSNVTEWFRNTFSSAWQAVKNVFSTGGRIFSGIINGIAETFRNVVNTIIRGINKVIAFPFDKINNMLNDIREVSLLGIEPFKGLWGKNPLPVPQIPALAQGGYVKPNTPQLAMIGDNKHQGEVVAPEDKLSELLQKAVLASSGGYDREILVVLREILVLLKELDLNIVIDGKKLKDVIVQRINENTRVTGVCEINT